MKKILLLTLLSSATFSAYASFDMMLLGDNTTAGAQRVQRYDPINRINLGTFGQGFINSTIQDITVDQANNTAYVLESAGVIKAFNYNSGDYLGGFTVNVLFDSAGFDSNNGRLLIGSGFGGNVTPGRVIDLSGVTLLSLGGFASYGNPSKKPGENWYGLWTRNAGSTAIVARQYSSTTGANLGSSLDGPLLATAIPRNSIFAQDGRFLGLSITSGNLDLYSADSTVSGFSSAPTLLNNFGATTNANVDMVNGHGSLIYILNGTSLIGYDTSFNSTLGTNTLTFATAANIRGMAIVVAPEPGSMIAIGMGIFAIAKRKKRA